LFFKRAQNIIGVDIGSNMIKMVEISIKGNLKPVKWVCEKNLSGVSALSGDLDKKFVRKLVKRLKVCLRRLRPSTRTASICLTDPAVIMKEMTLPLMSEKEILENVRFELSEYFLTDFKDYQLSYRLLNGDNNKDKISVLVAAAPIGLLNNYRDIIQESGLKLKYMDIPVNCRTKLLARMGRDDNTSDNTGKKNCLCIADLGFANIDISIYDDENFCLGKVIAVQEYNYDETVLYEISQVIDYFHTKNHGKNLSGIILTGGRSYTDGLAENISKQLLLPVEVARPDMFAAFGEMKEDFPMALYFKAFGSAIRED